MTQYPHPKSLQQVLRRHLPQYGPCMPQLIDVSTAGRSPILEDKKTDASTLQTLHLFHLTGRRPVTYRITDAQWIDTQQKSTPFTTHAMEWK